MVTPLSYDCVSRLEKRSETLTPNTSSTSLVLVKFFSHLVPSPIRPGTRDPLWTRIVCVGPRNHHETHCYDMAKGHHGKVRVTKDLETGS